MTPQERQRVAELFERLATLENARRDPEAAQAINAGFDRAPHAAYALVQSVLVLEEAVKKAEARIRELEGAAPADEGFLGNIRDSLFGGRENTRGSVPSVRSGLAAEAQRFQNGATNASRQQPAGQGGSFLGTAAAAAVGVIGGTMLMNSLQGLLGNGEQKSALFGQGADKSGNDTNGDLARQAGADDIDRSGQQANADDNRQYDTAQNDDDDFGDDGDFDFGSDFDVA